MELSKASEFLRIAFGSDQVEFDKDGLYSLETDKGIGFTFVHLPPELRLYASPLAPEEYEEIDDKASFLEALLAVNYGSDIDARREFKAGFHPRVRVPMIAAVTPVEQLQIQARDVAAMRELCDDLHAVALEVREMAIGKKSARRDDEESAEHDFEAQDAPWGIDGPGLQA